MSNVTVRNIPFTNHYEVASTSTEEWLNTIIEKALDGYEIVEGTVVAYSLSKSLRMRKKGAEENTVETQGNLRDEPEVISKEEILADIEKEVKTTQAGIDLGINYDTLKEFDGDKLKLEEYALENFQIDLNRSKTFKNMVKELEKALKNRE